MLSRQLPFGKSLDQLPRLVAENPLLILEIKIPFVAEQEDPDICWDVLDHFRLIVDVETDVTLSDLDSGAPSINPITAAEFAVHVFVHEVAPTSPISAQLRTSEVTSPSARTSRHDDAELSSE